ncbi:Pre-mRNA-splicing factor cwc26 [Penicillium subrubescens]|uniref:Pre-mRNA-splicing factor cwc26 n=1 Tax=Penicillium subrubescens TaxID=1316194 RepID=A0A1Q5UCH4_9EURO|nr:Pre-mRNA-splicing factor cwc26 [Penicillium subrubescens]KAJ5886070.1 Pre-mRNA-splicing factor cwc26 [Penicillium subrubescens]OKP10177.1 Pre-mRNA-splicing factor cwc26 [Penicillium subrubescens]
MPGSLADYLAKNYLNADPAPERPKKKRKKTKATDTAGSGLIIADDDAPVFGNARPLEDDEYKPSIDTSMTSAEFRRTKKSGWKTLGGSTTAAPNSDQEAADAILASAAAERAARAADEDDDAPMLMENTEEDGEAGLRMESGVRAGLQTAADTAAMVLAQEKRKKAEEALYRDPSTLDSKSQETIYRDASGRIINVAMKRAEARRAEAEKKAKEEAAREALMGDVQRQARENRRQELVEIKAMPVARGIEDDALNEELKDVARWNDPAAQFLTEKRAPGASVTGKPLYRGAFQPNRYGIRPGHRWDGVDRGIGFEKEWFAARNKKSRFEALDYQWQMDE